MSSRADNIYATGKEKTWGFSLAEKSRENLFSSLLSLGLQFQKLKAKFRFSSFYALRETFPYVPGMK